MDFAGTLSENVEEVISLDYLRPFAPLLSCGERPGASSHKVASHRSSNCPGLVHTHRIVQQTNVSDGKKAFSSLVRAQDRIETESKGFLRPRSAICFSRAVHSISGLLTMQASRPSVSFQCRPSGLEPHIALSNTAMKNPAIPIMRILHSLPRVQKT